MPVSCCSHEPILPFSDPTLDVLVWPASPATVLRPPLKWAGGKTWQVPHTAPLFAPLAQQRYVEPFCGAGGMAIGLRPTHAVLNDLNPHLVNFFHHVQQGLSIEVEMANDRGLYDRHRARFNSLIRAGRECSADAAALFYFLNRTGFNGLCRFNNDGEFNVPFGRYTTISYAREFPALAKVCANWTFTVGDFASVPLHQDDFVYADPPYDADFTRYTPKDFTWRDQERAAAWLAQHSGPVVLVNQATPRIEALYRQLGYDVRFLDAPRRISCTGDRTPAREILATRNL